MTYKESRYDEIYDSLQERNNKPFDTKGQILRRTLSPYMYSNNNMRDFLDLLEKKVEIMIKMPQKIKIFSNYAVKKNDKYLV